MHGIFALQGGKLGIAFQGSSAVRPHNSDLLRGGVLGTLQQKDQDQYTAAEGPR